MGADGNGLAGMVGMVLRKGQAGEQTLNCTASQRLGLKRKVYKMSAKDKIIDALRRKANGETDRTFSMSELVLTAWTYYPNEFGLEFWEHSHPDTTRVLSCVMGARGLVAKGLLLKPSPKTYQLPPEPPVVVEGPRPIVLDDDDSFLLDALLNDPLYTGIKTTIIRSDRERILDPKIEEKLHKLKNASENVDLLMKNQRQVSHQEIKNLLVMYLKVKLT